MAPGDCCVQVSFTKSTFLVNDVFLSDQDKRGFPLSRGSVFELIKVLGITTTKGPQRTQCRELHAW